MCRTSRWGSARTVPLGTHNPDDEECRGWDNGRVSVDDVADELYALPPEDFIAARDEAAKSADGDDRKAVKALRRPTVSAYVVNALVRRRRDEVDALVALGDEMRDAMTGKGDVRTLTEERRHSISDLVGAAAEAADRELTAAIE